MVRFVNILVLFVVLVRCSAKCRFMNNMGLRFGCLPGYSRSPRKICGPGKACGNLPYKCIRFPPDYEEDGYEYYEENETPLTDADIIKNADKTTQYVKQATKQYVKQATTTTDEPQQNNSGETPLTDAGMRTNADETTQYVKQATTTTDEPQQNNSGDSKFLLMVLAIIVMAVTVVTLIAWIIVGIRIWKRNLAAYQKTSASDDNSTANPTDCANEPLYESIVYSACTKSARALTPPADIAIRSPRLPPPRTTQPAEEEDTATPPANISNRPAHPLPLGIPDQLALAQKGTVKYIHYDTVYEHRLDHMLRANPPQRRPCKCCPNRIHVRAFIRN